MDESTLESLGFQNLPYVEEKISEWLKRKEKKDPWDRYFESFEGDKVSSVEEAYRLFGHQWAHQSPIHPKPAQPKEISEIDERLKEIYSGFVGVEFRGIVSSEVEAFLIDRMEKRGFSGTSNSEEKRVLLDRLNRSELFETFLHTRFPGQKRFSLEGAETLIPMLFELVHSGAEEVVIGMAHRGRLNVLSNILKKSYGEIFAEFKEGYLPKDPSGDVKYHLGYFCRDEKVTIQLLPNPSHLESIYPVLEGFARGREEKGKKLLPIIIHGDAALAGQGVVYETMQFQNLPGYKVGGTIHLVINNQIGFTTLPEEGRSTPYCTDLAKAFGCPIFHINGDHPEEALTATRLALEVREKFGIDVFLDLVCYRKYGHNEGDEPAFTQPVEYRVIRNRPSVRELYRDQLIQEGYLEKSIAEEGEESFKKSLREALDAPLGSEENHRQEKEITPTSLKPLSKQELKETIQRATFLPSEFTLHPKIQQLYKQRQEAVQNEQPLDWGTVEMLTYASLLREGIGVRITGQDVGRGTFSHRQLRLIEQEKGKPYIPLQHLFKGQPPFDIYNSPLNEFASVGFEFGYSVASPKSLVIWEAQYGDFANGAQVMFDQYLSSSEVKWGLKSSLILFLPHGFEGQGPEHSSGRLERFLTLAADDNFRVTYPTEPAQLYHLLREQAVHKKPLIVMTPKELLRHPKAVSSLQDLAEGHFKKVILDPPKGDVHTLVLLTGHFFIRLEPREGLAFARIEQLYPFPKKEIEELIQKFPLLKRIVWCQEEPKNMGAWNFVKEELPEAIYIGRERKSISCLRIASIT